MSSSAASRWTTCLGTAAALLLAYKKGWLLSRAMMAESSIVIDMPPPRPKEAYLPDPLPLKLQRYRHPGHKHRMFMSMVRFPQSIRCDNQKCQRAIQFCETVLTCPRCDLDICAHCFSQPLDASVMPVDLAPNDGKINEDILFSPYRFESEVESVVFPEDAKASKKKMTGAPCIHAIVPNQALDAGQQATFEGVDPVAHNHDEDGNEEDDEDEEYDEDDEDDDEIEHS
jgi:hypothetical protein